MVDLLYARLQRRGYLRRDAQRMVNRDRNIFGALLLQMGQADAMITGVTRTFAQTMREVRRVLDPKKRSNALWHSCDGWEKPHGLYGRHHC